MKLLTVVVLVYACVAFGDPTPDDVCSRDVSNEVTSAAEDFIIRVFHATSLHYNNHFVLSFYSIWLSLSAMAEGATGAAQERLFAVLNLPSEQCLREKYYRVIRKHERACTDLKRFRKRLLAYDDGLCLNNTWASQVSDAGLLEPVEMPIRSDPELAKRQLSNLSRTSFDYVTLSGDSLLLDTFDYTGLWSSAFPDSFIEKNAAFYNDAGEIIGSTDYIHMKRFCKMAYLPQLGFKILEIPVDRKERYSLLFFLATGSVPVAKSVSLLTKPMLDDVLGNLRQTLVPIPVAMPRFKIASHHDDMQIVLEQIGLSDLFKDPAASELVSDPPAMPTAYIQHVSVKFDVEADDYRETVEDPTEAASTFYVNRPFVFVFVHNRTKASFFLGAYSQPPASA